MSSSATTTSGQAKFCKLCGTTKPAGEFSRSTTSKDGLYPCCRRCNVGRAKAWELANREYARAQRRELYQRNKGRLREAHRRNRLRNKFGITPEDYDRMLASQGGGCAICGTTVPRGQGRFHVDHDHATGRVRGLLCNNHNVGLGAFDDSIANLQAAIEYLRRHGGAL
jgi:hypothetical protein